MDATMPERWSASSAFPDMWVEPDVDPREDHPPITDERSNLTAYLKAYRTTLELKCEGLDAAALAQRSVPPSDLSLLGLVRHMAEVERYWFREVLGGERTPARYRLDDDRDASFAGALGEPDVVAEAFAAWRDEIAFADDLVGRTEDLSTRGEMPGRARSISMREVLLHMVEEYARHCGHADLLRERIDGRIGQ